MHIPIIDIKPENLVGDIVSKDYRSAEVFKKFGIEFCCGARRSIKEACEVAGIELNVVLSELNDSIRDIRISSPLAFNEMPVDFLVDYIQNLHHGYLKKSFPELLDRLEHYVEGHQKKYPGILRVQLIFKEIIDLLNKDMAYEENIIFPYVRQINNALKNNADYGALLVRTLRKPIDRILKEEQENLRKLLHELRRLTDNYAIPATTCLSQKVILQKLKEMDSDLVQHNYLENSVLLPKVVHIEKELLQLT